MIFRIRGFAPISAILLLLTASSVGYSTDVPDKSIAEAVSSGRQSQPETSLRPSIIVVKNGESALRPEKCRATLIGPGVNQPDPFPGYGGFVGWNSPVRLKNGDWLIGFSAGYWHASPPTPLRYSPKTLERYHRIGLPMHVVAPTGGRAMLIRSTDAGKTWSKPATLIDTPVDDRHPAFIELKDGTLLCSLFTYTGTEESRIRQASRRSQPHASSSARSTTARRGTKAIIDRNSPLLDDESDGPMVLRKDGSVLLTIDGGPKGGGKSQVALLTQPRSRRNLATPFHRSSPITTCTRRRPQNCRTDGWS